MIDKMLKNFTLNIAVSLLICVISAFLLLALTIDEKFLKDGVTIAYFSTFSFFYLITQPRTQPHVLPRLGGLSFKSYCLAAIYSIFAFLTVALFVSATSGYAYIPPDYDWKLMSPLIFILISAAHEEILFRGYILQITKRFTCSDFLAAIFASTIFSLAHLPWKYGALEYLAHFAFGMAACSLTSTYRSLSPAIMLHFIFNYGVGSDQLAYELTKLHPGVIHFHATSPTKQFLFFSTIVFLLVAMVTVHLGARRAKLTN